MSHIYFYGRSRGRVDGKYRFLSNFYKNTFTIQGITFLSVEHYFQYVKHKDTELGEQIINSSTPMQAKKLSSRLLPPQNWEQIKEDVMIRALRAKFMQNKNLQKKLLSTENSYLHEDSPDDFYWGIKGLDRLGKLLEQVRYEISTGYLQVCPECFSDNLIEEKHSEYTGGGYSDYWFEYECSNCGNIFRSKKKSDYV